ncbi:MAG: hypothetical protein WAS05_08000 [Candidatus Nanopelagicales bacterium]
MPSQRDAIKRASSEEVSALIDFGEQQAFHGSPVEGIEPLLRAVALARANTDFEVLLRAEWLLGVCYGASGDYARALEILEPQVASDIDGARYRSQGMACTTIASIYRQVAEHARAEEFDQFALVISDGDPEVEFDAKLGLVADAVGLGDDKLAKSRLRVADRAAVDAPGWRTDVRLGWVRCEIGLLTNDHQAAVEGANQAVDIARRANAPRHRAKSLMFLGASHLAWSQSKKLKSNHRKTGVAKLRDSVKISDRLGATPLVWPVRLILASEESGLRAKDRQREHRLAKKAIRKMVSGMSADMGSGWLARLRAQGVDLRP